MMADVISMDEFRRRRFAPPRRATPVLPSRLTRDRLRAIHAEAIGGAPLASWLRAWQRQLFVINFSVGIAIFGSAILLLIAAIQALRAAP